MEAPEEFEDGPEEDPEEDPEEEFEDEPEEDPEEDPDMDSEEEPEEESCDEPDEELPQEPSAPEPNSNPLKSQKEIRHDEPFKAEESNGKSAFSENGENAAKQEENNGSYVKRRRSRWEQQPEKDGKIIEVDKTIKRRKSRWDDADTSQLNMLNPGQLPGSKLDPEVEKLKLELLEIKVKLLRTELEDDRPEEERSISRQMSLRKELIDRRQHILWTLAKTQPFFNTPPPVKQPPKLFKKIPIPVEKFPTYNFVGLIMGPRGNTHKKLEKESGAKIHLRGTGSRKNGEEDDTSTGEDLHVLIEAKNQHSVDAAVAMVEKLLIPVDEQINHLKRDQLEELAKLKGTFNICKICKEQGHMHFACPNQKSTFDTVKSCTTCGSLSHIVSTCPMIVSSHFRSGTKDVSDRSLYVGYLPPEVDDNRLRELFCPFGKIVDVKVIRDRSTRVSKGYGFVNFETSSDADMAVTHMHGHLVEGKMLVVRVAGHPAQVAQTPTGLPDLPKRPGFAAVSAVTQGQTSWPGPPGSIQPEVEAFYRTSEGYSLTSSSIPLGHINHPAGSILPAVVSNHPRMPQHGNTLPAALSNNPRMPQHGNTLPAPLSNNPRMPQHGSILPAAVSNHPMMPQHGSILPAAVSNNNPRMPQHGTILPAAVSNHPRMPQHGSILPAAVSNHPMMPQHGSILPAAVSNHPSMPQHGSILPAVVSNNPRMPQNGSILPAAVSNNSRMPQNGSILPAAVPNHPRMPQQGSSYDSLYRLPNQKPDSPPRLPQFPGDPDYLGSQMSPFFGASTQKPSLFDFSQTRDSAGPTSGRY